MALQLQIKSTEALADEASCVLATFVPCAWQLCPASPCHGIHARAALEVHRGGYGKRWHKAMDSPGDLDACGLVFGLRRDLNDQVLGFPFVQIVDLAVSSLDNPSGSPTSTAILLSKH